MIANELDSIHGHQDAAHGSSQATASDKGVVEGAKDQTASALKYAEDQLRQKSDKVLCTALPTVRCCKEGVYKLWL